MRYSFLIALISTATFAHGDMNGVAVGPDKAVLEAERDKGFRLSEKALANLALKTTPVKTEGGGWVVPRSALVYFQEHTGVYRLRDGWFYKVDVSATNKGTDAVVRASGLRVGDLVVSENVGLLRATDLDIEGGEDHDDEHDHDHEEGHGEHGHEEHEHGEESHKH